MWPEKMAQVLSTIQPTLDYAGIERAQVIVEAVVENQRSKPPCCRKWKT